MDREMIVKWFEFCRVKDKCSTDCPYFDNTGSARECTNKLAKDVLTLLKEQEPKQVETEEINDGRLYRCPSCHMAMMLRKQLYCHYCGQAVKWEC